MSKIYFILLLILPALSIAAPTTSSVQKLEALTQFMMEKYQPKAHENDFELLIEVEKAPFLNDRFASHKIYSEETPILRRIFITDQVSQANGASLDAAAVVLCHELGHAFGGRPYSTTGDNFSHPFHLPGLTKSPANGLNGPKEVSIEGQADFFVFSSDCFKDYAEKFKSYSPSLNAHELTRAKKLCNKESFCLRSFNALKDYLILLQTLEEISHDDDPDYLRLNIFSKDETPLPKTVKKTKDFYPPPSCRLKTFRNAILGRKSPGKEHRPQCWYVH